MLPLEKEDIQYLQGLVPESLEDFSSADALRYYEFLAFLKRI